MSLNARGKEGHYYSRVTRKGVVIISQNTATSDLEEAKRIESELIEDWKRSQVGVKIENIMLERAWDEYTAFKSHKWADETRIKMDFIKRRLTSGVKRRKGAAWSPLGEQNLGCITSKHLTELVTDRIDKGDPAAQTNTELQMLKAVMKHARAIHGASSVEDTSTLLWSYQDNDNVRLRIPTHDELKDLLSVLRNPIHKGIVVLGIHTGSRRMEITRLKWCDVKADHIIMINTKRGGVRIKKSINASMQTVLDERRAARKGDHPYVFASNRRKDMHVDCSSRWFQAACKNAGINSPAKLDIEQHPENNGESLVFHHLRAGYAVNMAQQDHTIYEISKALSHKSVLTTQRYLQNLLDDGTDASSATMEKLFGDLEDE